MDSNTDTTNIDTLIDQETSALNEIINGDYTPVRLTKEQRADLQLALAEAMSAVIIEFVTDNDLI